MASQVGGSFEQWGKRYFTEYISGQWSYCGMHHTLYALSQAVCTHIGRESCKRSFGLILGTKYLSGSRINSRYLLNTNRNNLRSYIDELKWSINSEWAVLNYAVIERTVGELRQRPPLAFVL